MYNNVNDYQSPDNGFRITIWDKYYRLNQTETVECYEWRYPLLIEGVGYRDTPASPRAIYVNGLGEFNDTVTQWVFLNGAFYYVGGDFRQEVFKPACTRIGNAANYRRGIYNQGTCLGNMQDRVANVPYISTAGTITPWMEFFDGNYGDTFITNAAGSFARRLIVNGYETANYDSGKEFVFLPVITARTGAGSVPFIALPKTLVEDWETYGISINEKPTAPGEDPKPKE